MKKTLLFLSIFFIGCQNVEFRRLSFKPDASKNIKKERHVAENKPKRKPGSNTYKAASKKRVLGAKSSQEYDLRNTIVQQTKSFVGVPYQYGGKTPNDGFDCSGLVSYVFGLSGMDLTGSSASQALKGKQIALKDVKIGDLVFFGNNVRVTHVAIVESVKADKLYVLHSTSSRGVIRSEIRNSKYWMDRYLHCQDFVSTHIYEDIALD